MHRGSEGGTHRTNQLVQPPKPLLKDAALLKETYSQPKRREKQHHELKHFTTEMSEVILPSCRSTKQHEVQKCYATHSTGTERRILTAWLKYIKRDGIGKNLC